jgi:large subunit ribosomal protein L21e
MAKRSKGLLSKRTRLLRARIRKKATISTIIREFKVGDKVSIDHNSRYSGMPHPRYRGKTGTVLAKRGNAYVVEVSSGNAMKQLIIPPVHLR